MSKTVPFQTIQFSLSMQFSSIQPIDRALSGATILWQREPGSNGNEGVLSISQSPNITGTSPSNFFMSYPGHLSYPSAEVQSVYCTAPANKANQSSLGCANWCADTCIASLCMGFESHACNILWFTNLCFTSSNKAIMPQKQPKTFVVWKLKSQLISVE